MHKLRTIEEETDLVIAGIWGEKSLVGFTDDYYSMSVSRFSEPTLDIGCIETEGMCSLFTVEEIKKYFKSEELGDHLDEDACDAYFIYLPKFKGDLNLVMASWVFYMDRSKITPKNLTPENLDTSKDVLYQLSEENREEIGDVLIVLPDEVKYKIMKGFELSAFIDINY